MKPFMNRGHRRRGIAVIMAMMSLVILGILAAGFITGSMTEHRMSLNEIEATGAIQLADGGARAAFQWLKNQAPPPCQSSGSTDPLGTVTIGRAGSARPTIYYAGTNNCSNPQSGWNYTIRSTGSTPGSTPATVELLAKASQSSAACFAAYLGKPCPDHPSAAWFGDFDLTTGPAHHNCKFWLYNSSSYPQRGSSWWGKVTQVSLSFRTGGTPQQNFSGPDAYATFYDGYQTGVTQHEWPPNLAGVTACGLAADGHDYTGRRYIQFLSDATYRMRSSPTGSWTTYTRPNNGVIYIRTGSGGRADVDISGTYRDTWTILADGHINIVGDVIAANDPRFGGSTDMMGLIAGKNTALDPKGMIVFPDVIVNGVDGDRQVFAYLMVVHNDGSWSVPSYSSRNREGWMIIYGGYAFAYIGPTETSDYRRGYGTDLQYDDRGCVTGPPPCYPPLVTVGGSQVWSVTMADSSWREIY